MARLSEALAGGDRRGALEALRDRVVTELDGAEGRDVATLSRELRLILAALDSLPTGREVSKVVDLSARVAARRAEATG